MADNATTPGGITFAADEISGAKYQRVKLTLGADGVNDNDVSSANPIPTSGPVTSVPTDPFGANADASTTAGSISAKLKYVATSIGTPGEAKVTDPDSASATQLGLLRGILNKLTSVQLGGTMLSLIAGTADIGKVSNTFASGVISNTDVDSLETVAEIAVGPYKTLFVTFTVATSALTDFNIDARAHASGDYVTLFGITADYTLPDGGLLWTSGDLTVAATSGTHGFIMDVSCFETVRIQAAGTNSVVAGHYGAK